VIAVGVVAAAVVILLSVLLHEAGHFATAKWFGMKATQFFVGFGPTLWSTRRSETEYGVKAIPAGGFVKIIGMTPLEEVPPGDEDRAFYRYSAPRRTVVLAAGSVVHFLLAIVITYLVLVFAGDVAAPTTTSAVIKVPRCVYTSSSQTACPPGAPTSPAFGKLHSGDRLLAVDGRRISSPTALGAAIDGSGTRPVQLLVRRHGRLLHVTVTPVLIRSGGREVARIGILDGQALSYPHYGALGSVPRTFDALGTYLVDTGRGLAALPSTVYGILAGQPRNPNGPVSVVGAARVSGQLLGATQIPLSIRIGAFFVLMASLNFFIGLFNLLPLLPLDGGHIEILAFEQARSRLYRLFGRRDPGRVDLNKILPVTYAVVVLFVGLAVVLLYADIFHPINLSG
jgi:membrane-associated protease RseP (regulator of RpoE activity)